MAVTTYWGERMTDAMSYEELVESAAARVRDALAEPRSFIRKHGPGPLVDFAAALYGENDGDVKALRGIQGPVAESDAYLEKATGGFFVILRGSRRYSPYGPTERRAYYIGARLDRPGDLASARCEMVHTKYLANDCEAIGWRDVPLAVRAALLAALARFDAPGAREGDTARRGGRASDEAPGRGDQTS